MQVMLVHGKSATTTQIQLNTLIKRLAIPGMTPDNVLAYSLFRRNTPFKLRAGITFPPGSEAERDHLLLGSIRTLHWGAGRGRWERSEVWQVWLGQKCALPDVEPPRKNEFHPPKGCAATYCSRAPGEHRAAQLRGTN